MLEHKIRPTAKLKAVFSLKPCALVSHLKVLTHNTIPCNRNRISDAAGLVVSVGWCGKKVLRAECREALPEC